jgi:hypothetical protein
MHASSELHPELEVFSCFRLSHVIYFLFQMNGLRVLQSKRLSPDSTQHMTQRKGNVRRELAKLVAHHLLSNGHLMVNLAIVNLELEPNKIGKNSSRSRLCPDWRNLLAGFRPHKW